MIACQQADECEGFTYNAVLQQCFLKREQVRCSWSWTAWAGCLCLLAVGDWL